MPFLPLNLALGRWRWWWWLSGTDAVLHLNRGPEYVGVVVVAVRHRCRPSPNRGLKLGDLGPMKEMIKDEEEPTFGQVASELYLTTLAKFHPTILSTMFSESKEEMDTPAGVEVQDPDKEEEEPDLQIGMMQREDEDEEEEEKEEYKEKVLAVDYAVARDDFTPGAEGEVPLASYVRAYQEFKKFIKLMGPLFYFVAYDAKRKVTYSLQRYQYSYKLMDVVKKEMAGENGRYYVDVRTMINYEKENDLVYRSSPMSGTDAVLHLNRGLGRWRWWWWLSGTHAILHLKLGLGSWWWWWWLSGTDAVLHLNRGLGRWRWWWWLSGTDAILHFNLGLGSWRWWWWLWLSGTDAVLHLNLALARWRWWWWLSGTDAVLHLNRGLSTWRWWWWLSGTDAVLHLNRGLKLAIGLMKEMMKDEEEPTFGQVASELYLTTMAKFHPSMLSTMFSGVLLLMPSRATVRNRIARGTDEGEVLLRRLMPEAIRSVTQTYEACQALYRQHDLHNLNVRGRTATTPLPRTRDVHDDENAEKKNLEEGEKLP
ncbi:Ceramide-1-phosphate transfer protein [Chionoecetes opilio]|uniref:Ceramide-1-phosphate transfer protein n=1 Tax=Chionoecetes opilio TaxID=41210 RepID=A0A8J4XZQ4_CHIOP|nr:Ceramide-1-phosphate transfer protein [Chionoecetes opilio]